MNPRSIISPKDQSATFVELFFDLVFVFSVTQVVGLLHGELSWTLIGQAVLVFWLVWWAWTQFTWSLNAADTTHPVVELGTLAATAVAFFMAVALPNSFHSQALWFAIPYVLVRIIGLGLYAWVAWENPSQRRAVRIFSLVSMSGLLAVLAGGITGGSAQLVLWGLAIVLDVLAAAVGGQQEGWNIHPEHFGERHGLFVIIALGETLIVAAGGISGQSLTPGLITVAVLSVAITCGLWWLYFTWAKPELDRALEESRRNERTKMARDVFSLMHFPMICGIIGYAVAIEEAIAHPSDPLAVQGRLALALGLALFIGGMVPAIRRATGRVLAVRLFLTRGIALAIMAMAGTGIIVVLSAAFAGILVLVWLEQLSGSRVSAA